VRSFRPIGHYGQAVQTKLPDAGPIVGYRIDINGLNRKCAIISALKRNCILSGPRTTPGHCKAGTRVKRERTLRLSDIKELFEQMRDWRKQKGRRST